MYTVVISYLRRLVDGMVMKEHFFKIGDFCFGLKYPATMRIPNNFMKFCCGESANDLISLNEKEDQKIYFYNVKIMDEFPCCEGNKLLAKKDLVIFHKDGKETRYIGALYIRDYYGCYQEVDDSHANIYIRKSYVKELVHDPMFVSLFALEKHMICKDSMVLHCAYMVHNGKAILFSAPSETGKSTQANLWGKYRGSRTINGDRALLHKQSGIWTADGWPVCGSSEICNNEAYPIQAIVMLSQAPVNTIERWKGMKAFSNVYSQITINRWNQDIHNRAMNLIEDLVVSVPVYHLSCNISEDAVRCLEEIVN